MSIFNASCGTLGYADRMEQNSVEIIVRDQECVVRVFENGEEARRDFHSEEAARAFAEGQRIRLKLSTYGRVTEATDACAK